MCFLSVVLPMMFETKPPPITHFRVAIKLGKWLFLSAFEARFFHVFATNLSCPGRLNMKSEWDSIKRYIVLKVGSSRTLNHAIFLC